MVLVDQVGSLSEDDRLDYRLDSFGDDLAHTVAVPSLDQPQDAFPDAVELLLACPEVEVDHLAVESPQRGPAVDQATVVEGTAESNHRGLGDDRLVEVEERGLKWAIAGRDGAFDTPHALTVVASAIRSLPKVIPVGVSDRVGVFARRDSPGVLTMAAAVATATPFRRGWLRGHLIVRSPDGIIGHVRSRGLSRR